MDNTRTPEARQATRAKRLARLAKRWQPRLDLDALARELAFKETTR